MITATEPKNSFAAAFEEFEGRLDGGRPWLRELRQAALARFLERGFPTTRDEDWRFTNVSALERTPFRPAAACDLPAQRAMLRALPWDVGGEQMILVHGRYAPDLSTLSAENGVRCGSLASALATGDGELEDHLAQYADYMDCSFVALNTAFIADGAYVRIPRRHVAERPLHIVHISVPGEAPSMVHPRTLVLVDDEAQASIVESYISLGEGTSFTNAVTELVVGERAQLRHYKLAREALGTYHIGTVQIHQKRDSEVLSHCITLAADWSGTISTVSWPGRAAIAGCWVYTWWVATSMWTIICASNTSRRTATAAKCLRVFWKDGRGPSSPGALWCTAGHSRRTPSRPTRT